MTFKKIFCQNPALKPLNFIRYNFIFIHPTGSRFIPMKALITTRVESIFNTIDQVDDFEKLEEKDLQKYYVLLNEYAENNNIALHLFNKTTLNYENVTPSFYHFWGIDNTEKINNFRELYPRVLDNINALAAYIEIHEKIMNLSSTSERMFFNSTFCGVKATNLAGAHIRLMWHATPLILNGHKQSKILLCVHKDVIHLMEGDIFWIRVSTGKHVYSWFSDQKEIRKKEIVSGAELACIRHWAAGMGLSDIAQAQCISIHTVKNHLKAARKRLGARDNTALMEMCMLLGIC